MPISVQANTILDLWTQVDSLHKQEQNSIIQQTMEQMPELKNGALAAYLKISMLQQKYDEAKAIEQSKANRMLTALSVAAAGIGGMELAMGLAEQKADKEAEQDMAAYIATMRSSYADGQQVKAGPDEIELPGGTVRN